MFCARSEFFFSTQTPNKAHLPLPPNSIMEELNRLQCHPSLDKSSFVDKLLTYNLDDILSVTDKLCGL